MRLGEALRVAVDGATLAGDLARGRFRTGVVMEDKGDAGDVVTEVDRRAEDLIVGLIATQFPTHDIWAEERGGIRRGGEWQWFVDPLDGTNNYALGLPVYGVSIALLHNDRPVVGVIRDSDRRHTYWACEGQGAWCDDERITVSSVVPPNRMTVGWVQGYHVRRDDPDVRRTREAVEHGCKRVLALWAPSISWAMLARGSLEGLIVYDSEREDLFAGALLTAEAGAKLTTLDGDLFTGAASPPSLLAGHPDNHAILRRIIDEAERPAS